MAQKVIAGVTVDVTEEGYLTDPSQWTKESQYCPPGREESLNKL